MDFEWCKQCGLPKPDLIFFMDSNLNFERILAQKDMKHMIFIKKSILISKDY
jgi:hypothetical protein